MQERKNKRLVILLFALCCMTAIVYSLSRNDGKVEVDKNIFKNYDLKSIDQVVMESKKGRIELKLKGAKWDVNHQFDADQSMIEVLFATLQQAEPKRPVAASLQDSINNALKLDGTKVSLLSSGEVKSTFYAGGNIEKTQTFFGDTDDDPKSYLVGIPGYRVYVSGIFELPETEWKNKYVFGFNWRNFHRLECKFPQKSTEGFEVVSDENTFAIPGVAALDTAKLNDFLDDVSLLTVDGYKDQSVFPDSIAKPLPLMSLVVKDIAQRLYTLELYQSSENSNAIPGLINGVQWAFFDQNKIRKILRQRAFFEK